MRRSYGIFGPASKRKYRSLGKARTVIVPRFFGKSYGGPLTPALLRGGIVGPQTVVGHPACFPLATIWISDLQTCLSTSLPVEPILPEFQDTMSALVATRSSTSTDPVKLTKAPPRFPCSHCDKVFKRSEHRARHERSRMDPITA